MASLPDGCIDAVVTDPPYSSGGRTIGEKSSATKTKYLNTDPGFADFDGDSRDQRSWTMWSTLWLTQAYRVCRSGSSICIFTDWRMLPATTDVLQCGGFTWRGIAVWDKTRACRPNLGRFDAQSEYIVWGSKGKMPIDRLDCRGRRNIPGVLSHRVDPKKKKHITAKPGALMDDILHVCVPGSVVLDPFAGSGETGAAALRKGCRALLAETVPYYQDVAEATMRAAETV